MADMNLNASRCFVPHTINVKGRLINFNEPKVMGIVNVTPDSFFQRSRLFSSEEVTAQVEKMMAEGVDMFDVGGYSTRPGAAEVTPDEELRRLEIGVSTIRKLYPDAVISVDTFRANVAECCIRDLGADIINDISGGDLDADMFATVADLQVPYVLMHTRGTPATMNQLCNYSDVTAEVLSDLAHKLSKLRQFGVADVIVDPGFGFAKTVEQNFELMANLQVMKKLNCPLLVGISHKSMIFKPLGITPDEALNGTTVLNTISLLNGADILRVHDVKEARECVKLVGLMNSSRR